jgi:hypothetical protein
MHLFIRRSFLSLLLFSPYGQTSIYKCEVDGVHIYSQFPCSDKAEKIEIEVIANSNKVISSDSSLNSHSKIEDTNLYIELNKTERLIQQSEGKIKKYQRNMNSEINALKQRSGYANNNLAGATYAGALSTQMNAVATKYNSLIEVEQKKVERLYDQKSSLSKKRDNLQITSQKNDEEQVNSNNLNNKTSVNEYIKNRKIDRDILNHQNKINKYKKQMSIEINNLKVEASLANNNLAGARYESAKSNEMNAVANKYNSLITTEQKKIDMLYKEKLKTH